MNYYLPGMSWDAYRGLGDRQRIHLHAALDDWIDRLNEERGGPPTGTGGGARGADEE